jgi:hypothetical protein
MASSEMGLLLSPNKWMIWAEKQWETHKPPQLTPYTLIPTLLFSSKTQHPTYCVSILEIIQIPKRLGTKDSKAENHSLPIAKPKSRG